MALLSLKAAALTLGVCVCVAHLCKGGRFYVTVSGMGCGLVLRSHPGSAALRPGDLGQITASLCLSLGTTGSMGACFTWSLSD